ncbi:MAG: DUF4926 domain-containing protein [Saprospiraceae bacterium]
MDSIILHHRIVLTHDLSGSNLKKGDVGTVVETYNNGEVYEIEFFALDGSTLDVQTVDARFLPQISTSPQSLIVAQKRPSEKVTFFGLSGFE